jgi:hypothetical protein
MDFIFFRLNYELLYEKTYKRQSKNPLYGDYSLPRQLVPTMRSTHPNTCISLHRGRLRKQSRYIAILDIVRYIGYTISSNSHAPTAIIAQSHESPPRSHASLSSVPGCL